MLHRLFLGLGELKSLFQIPTVRRHPDEIYAGRSKTFKKNRRRELELSHKRKLRKHGRD